MFGVVTISVTTEVTPIISFVAAGIKAVSTPVFTELYNLFNHFKKEHSCFFTPHCPNYITCYFQSFHRGYTLLLLWALMNMKSINQVRDCSNGNCSKQAPFLHRSIRLRNGMDCLLHKRQLFLSKNRTENIRNELRLLHLHRTASPVCLL